MKTLQAFRPARMFNAFGRWSRAATCLALAGCLCVTAADGAGMLQPDKPGAKKADAPAAPARTTVLTFEIADLDSLLVDPKDAGLKAALKMLPARINELPNQIPDLKEAPATLFSLVGSLIGRSARLGVEFNMNDTAESRFGAHIVLSAACKDEQDAAAMHAMVNATLASLGGGGGGGRGGPIPSRASTKFPTMLELSTEVGVIRWGPRPGAGGLRYEVHFGSPRVDEIFKPNAAALAAKGKVVMQSSLDLAPLTPLTTFLVGLPGAAPIIQNFAEAGWIGDEAVRIESASYFTETHSVTNTRTIGAHKFAAGMGRSLTPLTADDMKVIPADAAMATIIAADIDRSVGSLADLRETVPPVGQVLGMVKQQTGVDLVDDVLKNLGGTMGAYTSDSTGGSSLGSLVLFCSVKNSVGLNAANTKLVAELNRLLASPETARGFVAVRSYKVDDVQVHSLQFPGLPVPIELSYAITNKWLFLGFNPQAVAGAVVQAGGMGDGGIATNPEFAKAIPAGRGIQSATFLSAPRLLRGGYSWLSMSGSFISNAVRSNDAKLRDRDPGMIVPPYHKLVKGAQSSISYSYWEGEDLVSVSQADRSMLVNIGTIAGVLDTFAPVIVAGIAAAAAAANEVSRFGPPPMMAPQQAPPRDRQNRPNFSLIPAGPDDWRNFPIQE